MRGISLPWKTHFLNALNRLTHTTHHHLSPLFIAQSPPFATSAVTRLAYFASRILNMALPSSECRIKSAVMPASVCTRDNDPCRYWNLWHHLEDIDSIIACFLWRDTHLLRPRDIAAALAFAHPAEYWGIDAEDVINVYEYLHKYQEIPENPFVDWQNMRDRRTHPHWRYYVIWASSCEIQRVQNLLNESLLPVHKQS